MWSSSTTTMTTTKTFQGPTMMCVRESYAWKDWPALLWSRDLGCGRRRWDGWDAGGTNGQPDSQLDCLSIDTCRCERNGQWYVVPALKQRVSYRNAEWLLSAITPMAPLVRQACRSPMCASPVWQWIQIAGL